MEEDKFRYTYAAPTQSERREVENIRRQYLPRGQEEDKLRRLRKLHARVRNAAMGVALALGIAGVLLFGLGMSLTLAWDNYVAGIAISAAGIIPMAAAAPAHRRMLRRGERKYGEEILRLSGELLGKDG